MSLPPVIFSDTTLRDGEQMPGASLDPAQKLEIARALAQVGVHNIEAGFPASSPREAEAVRLVAREVRGTVVSAFCRALPRDIDAALAALDGADKPGINIFLATSPLHRRKKLGKSREQILEMITSAVSGARRHCDRVAYGAEDASRTEPEFLAQAYGAAIAAGATTVGFPDTVGILTPQGAAQAVGRLRRDLPILAKVPLAVHFHNDLGLAAANTLAALAAGAMVAQCTVGGLGERAGNAALEELAVTLSLHQDEYQRAVTLDLTRLHDLGALVSRLTGVPLAPQKAVLGANVFATEAGVHQDGLIKDPDTYLPYRPEMVGAPGIRLVLGPRSGRAAFARGLKRLGYDPSDDQLDRVTAWAKGQPKRRSPAKKTCCIARRK